MSSGLIGTINSLIPVKSMMRTDIATVQAQDTIEKAIRLCKNNLLDMLPVVDADEHLVGVLPKWGLFQAVLDGRSLCDSCEPYVVYNPIFVKSDLTYNEMSLVVRGKQSRVGAVPVVDEDNKVVGIVSKLEFLRESYNLATMSYAFLDSIFQGIYEGMIVVDNKGSIMKVNPSAENMFGINKEEVTGQRLCDLFPEIPFSRQISLGVRASLRSIPVIINQVPIVQNGRQIGVNIALLDLSDIEQMAKELEMVKELQAALDGVLEATSDGVFVMDSRGIIKYVNKSACSLVSKRRHEMIDRPLDQFLDCTIPLKVPRTGIPEVDVCQINGNNCIVSHIPMGGNMNENIPSGIISTIYTDDNRLTEEIARKWFSLRQQVQYYRDELEKRGAERSSFDQIVSRNNGFIKQKKEAQKIARSSSTILLTGESGVGKDMFARAIHASSPRGKHPFVKVNCAAIPETLLESELFGYEPGSFTGASKKGKPGYFEQAQGGTIFLDEIGDTPFSIQVKILQVLQEKQFMRVGGTGLQKVDVRIIAATNRDLREGIANGSFREDLFYRLNVISISLPPLRERLEDILPLAEEFIEKYNQILGSSIIGISQEAREVLTRHNWPGNIRELENAIERAANYAWEGEIGLEHLPLHLVRPDQYTPEQASYKTVLSEVDRDIIIDALKRTDGNKSAAARLLKISRSALYEKLAKYGIP